MNNIVIHELRRKLQTILKQSPAEPTFEDTVIEGKERRYTIINELDVEKYLNIESDKN